MNPFEKAAHSLRLGFEEQFQSAGSVSLFIGLACTLAFVGQVYFWPAMWHTSALVVSYTDATYVAELLCAIALAAHLRRSGRFTPSSKLIWASALLVQATLIAYCVLFELGIQTPKPLDWLFGAIFGIYLPVVMVSWLSLHVNLRPVHIIWNIMLAAVFAAFVIWIFSGLVGIKICACMGLLMLIGTWILTHKLKDYASEPFGSRENALEGFNYPASATFLFSFAFVIAISFAEIDGENASFATGAFFAPMLAISVVAMLVNLSATPLSNIAVPAIVMATIAASSLNIDPAISFDLAALGMFLFLAYAVLLLCVGFRNNREGAAQAFLKLMVAFACGCILGRVCMAACALFTALPCSDFLVLLSVLAANVAMVILIRRGFTQRRSSSLFLPENNTADNDVAAVQQQQLAHIASEHNLGERETEVLEVLLRGGSASDVARKLVIANGTAKSHIRHVYRKLGIHSRDELFSMFDTFTAKGDHRE